MEIPKSNLENEYQQISEQLQEMAKRDQNARSSRDTESILLVDTQNQEELKQIVSKYGWPSISAFGKDAANAAWLIAQHADTNPAFQRQCFEQMKSSNEQDISQEDLAYLADRIRVNEGKPQLFGTQWKIDEENQFGPEPIEDEENLDQRREEVGMEPFEEYAQEMQKQYQEWQNNQNSTETSE